MSLVCGILVWLVAAGAVNAQTFTAGVRGAVQEGSGAVIPGVAVQPVNEGTNASREIVSNERGECSFSAVPPGTYTVRASLTGFRAFERSGDAEQRAGDPRLRTFAYSVRHAQSGQIRWMDRLMTVQLPRLPRRPSTSP